MPRSPRDGPASGAWQWSRTAQTQRALLDAARQVFTERGFSAIPTSLIGEGSYEVAGARNRRQAESIIDAVIEYARRLMAGGLPPRD